ncbi:MAG: OmpA family protein [Geminicoccaceae bacterium]
MLRYPTALAAAALTFAAIGEATAHDAAADDGRLCNPVHDRGKSPLITSDGRFVIHGNTFDCPKAEPVVAAAAPAPEPVPVEPVVLASISSDVAFDLNKAELKPSFYGTLDQIITSLNESPETRFDIIGHADSTGEESYNQDLSERRAAAVADYLVRGGIAPGRFTASGRGELDPVASNKTREGRAQNRRVDIQSTS